MCNLHMSLEQPKQNEGALLNSRKSKGRLKIWDLHTRYHCGVLGTCLTLKELRHIAYKAKISKNKSFSDYDLHVSFVGFLNERSYISNLVNKLLDKKYKRNIQQLSKSKTNEERNRLWNKSIAEGNVAGAFWALISHPEVNESTLYNAYGKVHMLSHLSGASLRIDMQEFHRLKHQSHKVEQEIKHASIISRQQLNKKNQEIAQLKSQLLAATDKNTQLLLAEQELKAFKENPVIDSLQLEIDKLKLDYKQAGIGIERASDAVEIWKKRAEKEQKQRQVLEQNLTESHQEKQALENNLTMVLLKKEKSGEVDSCSSCPNTNKNLCGRCVLYIGGRSKQYSHFKELVEQKNGRFVHHDGGRENSKQHLASVVSQADVVLCPLDCVSHSAMNIVKRHCKSHIKPLIFIPHASLSAFSLGLNRAIN